MLKKSLLELLCLAVLLTGCDGLESDWNRYRARFVAPEGRIVDTGNGSVSHSEGQGYGLLLALAAGDREGFEKIWRWTRRNLQKRDDHLFIWRRRPGVPLSQEDFNDATDGDLLIAWALAEAAARWGREAWRREALAIASDLKRSAVRTWRGRSVLLPGDKGFERGDRLVLNLSYWVYPALGAMAKLDPDPVWGQLIDSGLALTRQARFGPWNLPPDWLEAGEGLKPWRERPPRFGYDAVRIPLYLIWGGRGEAELLRPFVRFWEARGAFTPPWINLQADCMSARDAPAGIRAIRLLSRHAAGRGGWFRPPPAEGDYYSATLVLLSRLAAEGR